MAGVSTTAPRPLQLASGSFITSLSPSAESLPSSQLDDPNSVGRCSNTPPVEPSCDYEPWIIRHQTPPTSTTITGMKRQLANNPRRHSSISYIHSDFTSPTLSSRRESVDGFVKSPLSASHLVTAFDVRQEAQHTSPSTRVNFQLGLSRSNSVGGVRKHNTSKSLKSPVSNRWSTESNPLDSKTSEGIKGLKDRPVTLAEKHSELLHFIAQKEAKCLELRSQLATHEAELLQLKRKWERIVSRGLEKGHISSSPTSSFQQSSPSQLPSTQISTSRPMSPQSAASPYFPLLPPVVNPHAPVLEGIKEGVQGVGRLIAAGLESIAGSPVGVSSTSTLAEPLPSQPSVPNSTSRSRRKTLKLGHGQNESQSSSSTSASASASSTFSTTSANTSFTSLEGQTTSPPAASTLLSVEESEHRDKESILESSVSDCSSEQVLFVRDTGATPTMSPNPEFEQKRRTRQRDGKRGVKLTDSSPVRKSGKVKDNDALVEVDWPNWEDVSSDSQRPERSHLTDGVVGLRPVTSTAASSSAQSPVTAPTAHQLSSWMDTVGKKWGEIKGTSTSTFVKNQKRASLLFSDMQNSFVTALASPTPSPSFPSSPSSKLRDKRPASPSFLSGSSPQYRAKRDQPPSKAPPPSLLDHSDTECGDAETVGKRAHSEFGNTNSNVHPTTSSVGPSPRTLPKSVSSKKTAISDTDNMTKGQPLDDEWNW